MPRRKEIAAPRLARKWRRLVAIGCTHGRHADGLAVDAVERFCGAWKPNAVLHLGDFIDTAAWRAGAKDTPDQTDDPSKDVLAGFSLLDRLGVTHLCMGNHDERPYRFLESPNGLVKYAAEQAVLGIERDLKRLRITFCNRWSVFNWIELGGWRWAHGWYYNENAARDHAESHGNIVFAHTHRVMLQKGRRTDNPTGICVGTLSQIENHDYSKARRATLGWSQGFVWGEYTENEAVLWLHENGRNEQRRQWRLPM